MRTGTPSANVSMGSGRSGSALATAVAFLLSMGPARPAAADTGAAEVAAGGLRLVREAGVAIREERLRIGLKRVSVEYVLFNETTAPISAEVAFPVEYRYAFDGYHDFSDFAASVNGKPIGLHAEVSALAVTSAGEQDVTAALRAHGVDIERFARIDDAAEVSESGQVLETSNQLASLPQPARKQLQAIGAIDSTAGPLWKVRAVYRWTQQFPPGRPVRVAIAYAPAVDADSEPPDAKLLAAACAAPGLGARTSRDVRWVKYALTTHDGWRTPIGKLDLVVDVPERAVASFCWDGAVATGGDRSLRAQAVGFVPKRELAVYYFFGSR